MNRAQNHNPSCLAFITLISHMPHFDLSREHLPRKTVSFGALSILLLLSDTYDTVKKTPTPELEQAFIDLLNHKQTFKSAANICLIQEYFSGNVMHAENEPSFNDATLEYMEKLMKW